MCRLVLVPPCCWRLQEGGGGLLVEGLVLVAVGALVSLRPLLLLPLMPLRLELLFFLTWKQEDGPTPLPLCPLPLRLRRNAGASH
jgi:hypothetical protein